MLLFLERRAKQSLCSPGQHLRQVICILSSEATLPSWMLDLSKDTIQVEISVLLRLRQAMSIWGYPCWVAPDQLTKLLPRYVLILWLDNSLQVGNWANPPSHVQYQEMRAENKHVYTWISKIKAIQGRIINAKEVVQILGKNGPKLTEGEQGQNNIWHLDLKTKFNPVGSAVLRKHLNCFTYE